MKQLMVGGLMLGGMGIVAKAQAQCVRCRSAAPEFGRLCQDCYEACADQAQFIRNELSWLGNSAEDHAARQALLKELAAIPVP